jgi:cytochrome c556
MTNIRIRYIVGAAVLGGMMAIGTSANAYWGGPRTAPWSGSGYPGGGYPQGFDRMHQRQTTMQNHKSAMHAVGRMLAGQRNFDRAEAIRLARAIQASAGEDMMNMFKPGDQRGNPLSRAMIGENMAAFGAQAEAMEQAAGDLADALETQPSPEDIWAGRAWSADWYRSRGNRGRRGPYGAYGGPDYDNDAVTMEALGAYNRLRATCHGCHAGFRSPRR